MKKFIGKYLLVGLIWMINTLIIDLSLPSKLKEILNEWEENKNLSFGERYIVMIIIAIGIVLMWPICILANVYAYIKRCIKEKIKKKA